MVRKPRPPPDDPEQSKRFIEMAREVEVDEDPQAFERAFDKVVRPKEPPPKGEGPSVPASRRKKR